eukprot:3495033-Pleurochrysis_carterae.AAC.1
MHFVVVGEGKSDWDEERWIDRDRREGVCMREIVCVCKRRREDCVRESYVRAKENSRERGREKGGRRGEEKSEKEKGRVIVGRAAKTAQPAAHPFNWRLMR